MESEVRYFGRPYIGERSQAAKQKVKKLIKKYCKNLVFNPCKIKDNFSTKDTLPACLGRVHRCAHEGNLQNFCFFVDFEC